jgi:hypothetical protein
MSRVPGLSRFGVQLPGGIRHRIFLTHEGRPLAMAPLRRDPSRRPVTAEEVLHLHSFLVRLALTFLRPAVPEGQLQSNHAQRKTAANL